MHSRVTAAVLATLLAVAVIVIPGAEPAAAQADGGPCRGCGPTDPPPVTGTDQGFATRVSVNRLNNGGSASGPPPVCSEEDIFAHSDKDGVPDHIGRMGYEEPDASQELLSSGEEGDGTYWRLSCFFDDGFDPGYPGISIDFFPEVTGPGLARLAVAEALTGVPAPEVRVNPTGDQLVNLPTWLWVDGIATTEFVTPPVTVPGISVAVTVSTGGVYWEMGDGAAFGCDGTGTAYGEATTPSCSHTYTRASTGQPGSAFHGSASVRWTATYTVNGAGPFDVADAVVRQTPFDIRVAESQAVVNG